MTTHWNAPGRQFKNRRSLHVKLVWIWAVALLGHSACHEPPRIQQHMDGEELPIIDQVQGTHSNETRPLQVVVRDSAALARIPLVDVPVDFSNQMLLIVTLGRKPSDQHSVWIERVWRDGSQLRVATKVKAAPPDAPVEMSSPYCIAVIPRSDLNVAGFLPEPPARERSWVQSEPGY